VISDERVGEGGFLKIRRLRVRLLRADGSRSKEGLYDFIERPIGLDAVVLAIWHRAPDGVRVLLRDGLRVPLQFGRADRPGAPRLHTELVAGIIERGEESLDAVRRRAAAEAHEEAGLDVAADSVVALGAPVFPTAGMCPERFYLMAVEVGQDAIAAAHPPPGDGSPFEEGARIRWLALDDALARCTRGEIDDMKTELILRRLAGYLDNK